MHSLLGDGGPGHQSTLPGAAASVAAWLRAASSGGGTVASALSHGELRRSSHASALSPRDVLTRSSTRLNRAGPVERSAGLAEVSRSGAAHTTN
ncbi:hypothetical protein SETIT_3G231700v2 [Setaria italica]|uniref:Uncharacterized protein n=1 Tax=Setaria italica TaxID=4555 RepID=A0A368QI47_SETIT|nr:hypothetical protein SETIT_3G231700v2 [Setaria italica]